MPSFLKNRRSVGQLIAIVGILVIVTFMAAIAVLPSSTIPASLPSEIRPTSQSVSLADGISSLTQVIAFAPTIIIVYNLVWARMSDTSVVSKHDVLNDNLAVSTLVRVNIVLFVVLVILSAIYLFHLVRDYRAIRN